MITKTVFISYSWDNIEHKEWVLNLANRLVKSGIDVHLDQYDLSAGKEMTYFMEKAMTCDKILVIMTPEYKTKADDRTGGVGYEYSLITNSLFKSTPDNENIIPILRSGNKEISSPSYLGTRIYFDMKDDSLFENNFFELLRAILEKPKIVKPKLGKTPDFDSDLPEIDESISKYKKKKEFLQNKERILFSEKGVKMFTDCVNQIKSDIQSKIFEYEEKLGMKLIQKPKNRYGIIVSTINYTGFFNIDGLATNSTLGAKIILNFFKGPVGLDPSIFYFGKQEVIYRSKYSFDLDENFKPIFKMDGNEEIILKTSQVSNKIIRDVILSEIEYRESQL